MEDRDRPRHVSQRHLEPAPPSALPPRAETGPPSDPAPAAEPSPGRVPTVPSTAELRSRQRVWLRERARFRTEPPGTAGPTETK